MNLMLMYSNQTPSLQATTLLTHNLLSRAELTKRSMIFSKTPLTAANPAHNQPALKPPLLLQAPLLLTHNLLSRAGLSKQSMMFSKTPLTAANPVRNLPALFSHFLQIHLHKAFFQTSYYIQFISIS